MSECLAHFPKENTMTEKTLTPAQLLARALKNMRLAINLVQTGEYEASTRASQRAQADLAVLNKRP